jgi:hypothetical protein
MLSMEKISLTCCRLDNVKLTSTANSEQQERWSKQLEQICEAIKATLVTHQDLKALMNNF